MNYAEKEMKNIGSINKATVAKFWAKVWIIDNPSACWDWTGSRDAKEYGIFCHQGKRIRATHFVWQLTKSEIPKGLVVMHTCDNPSCVRPSHLLLGTRSDNRRDCIRKGRHVKGTGVWKAKLNPAKVAVVRTLYSSGGHTQKEIGQLLGITQPAVSYVVRNINWKDTPA